MRQVSDAERRARLAVRHALAPSSRLDTPEAVARALTVLHATDPATVYLSYWTRSQWPDKASFERSLYEERSLVKQLAMRRTQFVFPRDLLPDAWGSASARVAGFERRRIAKAVINCGLASDGQKWLQKVRARVLSVLGEHPAGLPAQEFRKLMPRSGEKLITMPGHPSAISQVLTYLGARGDIVRATNRGQWYTSQTRWTLMRNWLSEVPKPSKSAHGYRELVRRWLRTFGPGTEADLAWWLGSTKSAVRRALVELAAVEVSLENSVPGWLLPDDLEGVRESGHWVALLPSLDPTVMGWLSREFYIRCHRDRLFDSQGNAGTTIWVDGRVVGFWVQDSTGAVHLRFLETVPRHAHRELESEAARLTEWLGDVRLFTVLCNRQ